MSLADPLSPKARLKTKIVDAVLQAFADTTSTHRVMRGFTGTHTDFVIGFMVKALGYLGAYLSLHRIHDGLLENQTEKTWKSNGHEAYQKRGMCRNLEFRVQGFCLSGVLELRGLLFKV